MKRLMAGLIALVLGIASVGCASSPAVMAAAPTVKAGSMARFIVHNGVLYALDKRELVVYAFNEKGGVVPERVRSIPIPADGETLFPYGRLLFVGTRQAMLVYELADHALEPKLIGRASHVVSCDPVVVENDIAYVTLRSESTCRRGTNALIVFDVKNPTQPLELYKTVMASPRGLGVDGSMLFVADAKEGLLVFDISNPSQPKRINELRAIAGYDVIADAGRLFVSAEDGLYQYKYGPEGLDPEALSKIPIGASKDSALTVAEEPGAK